MNSIIRLAVCGILPAFFFFGCVTDEQIKEMDGRIKGVENRQNTSREIVGELVSIQKKLVESQKRFIDDQAKARRILDLILKNQADMKDNMDALFSEVSRVVGRLEEDVYKSRELSDSISDLMKFLRGRSGNRFRELELSIMESNLINSLAIRNLGMDVKKGMAMMTSSLEKGESATAAPKAKIEKPDIEKKAAKPTIIVSEKLSAAELYSSAYRQFLKGNHERASAEFKAYVERYPDDDLSDNSQYWYAEALAGQGRDQEAADAFIMVAEKYPKSTKAPAALWRSVELYEKLGRTDDVVGVLGEIAENYPNSPQAALARKKLKAKTQ